MEHKGRIRSRCVGSNEGVCDVLYYLIYSKTNSRRRRKIVLVVVVVIVVLVAEELNQSKIYE